MKTYNLPLVLLLLGGLGLGLTCVEARAEKIPALAKVSPKLPAAEQQAFLQRSVALEAEWQDFKTASDRFNAKAAKDQSDQDFNALTVERAKYIANATQYNSEMAASVRAVESNDPKVVNAQRVPSGLPKDVETAIAGSFADAPAGVVNAVSKGFQAVMAHDWKVAAAWFGDALNRDPGNVALKNLLAAANSSPPAAPANPAAELTTAQVLQLPTDDDVRLLSGQRSRAQVIADDVFMELNDPGWKKFNDDERAASLKAAQASGDAKYVRLLQDSYKAYDLEKSRVGKVEASAPTTPAAPAVLPQTPVLQLLLDALKAPPKSKQPAVSAVRG